MNWWQFFIYKIRKGRHFWYFNWFQSIWTCSRITFYVSCVKELDCINCKVFKESMLSEEKLDKRSINNKHDSTVVLRTQLLQINNLHGWTLNIQFWIQFYPILSNVRDIEKWVSEKVKGDRFLVSICSLLFSILLFLFD